MKKEYLEYKEFIKHRKLLLFIGILCICVPPLVFWLCHLIVWGIRDQNIGQLGDIIGGTTAPFIGLLGAILIYISFQEQVKANEHLKDETNRVTSFKVYDTIIDLMKFTMKQYESLLGDEKIPELEDLIKKSETTEYIDDSEKEALKKYRCILDLVAQCCDCIGQFENIPQENFDYKNQLRAIFISHYHLFYKDIFKKTAPILNISKKGINTHFKYMGNEIEIDEYKDVRDENEIPRGKKVVYFIALSIKNIVDCMENPDSNDYWIFRGIQKPEDECNE